MFITIIKTLLTTYVVIPKYSQDLKHIPEIPRVAERAPLGPPAGLVKYIVIPDGKNTSILKDIYLHVINPRSMCSEKMFEIPCL